MNFTFNYNPDPGIMYDIIRMLYVKFNATNVWKETLTSMETNDQQYHYISEHAKILPDPKSELALFFYIPTNKKTTFMSMITDKMVSDDFSSFSISNIYTYLSDPKKVFNDVLSYYLGEQDYENIIFESLIRLSKTIPDRIKLLLFGFSDNPVAYISQLSNWISIYYSSISADSESIQISSTDLGKFANLIIEQSHAFHKRRVSLPKNSVIWFSLCTYTPDYLMYNHSVETPFFITTEYTIHEKINNQTSLSTQELLYLIHALNDQYRLSIIKHLQQHGSLSPTELSEKLSLSVTATKYHITLLKKANIVTIGRNSRSVYYTYNPNGYKNILKALENFEKGDFEQ